MDNELRKKLFQLKARLGRAQKISKCCREIRIAGAAFTKPLDLIEGFNTLTNQHEFWIIIKKPPFVKETIVAKLIKQ